MGQNRQRIDEVERLVVEREGWCESVRLELGEWEVPPAPCERALVAVAAVYAHAVEPGPAARDPSGAAAEVEDRAERVDGGAVSLEGFADRLGGEEPALEEPGRVRRACDADDERRRGQRQSVVGERRGPATCAEGKDTLVGAESGSEKPGALEQAEE